MRAASCLGLPHPIPTLCLSSLFHPLQALLSPFSWPLFLCPSSFPVFEPVGVAGFSGQMDPACMARLVASGCSCVQRGLEAERDWEEVVRVPGQTGEGWFPSPPPLKPSLLVDGSRQGCYCWTEAGLARSSPGPPASTHTPPAPPLYAGMVAEGQGPLLDSLGAQLTVAWAHQAQPFAAQSFGSLRSRVQ